MTFLIKYSKFISVLGLLPPLGYNPFNPNTLPWYYNVFINFNVLPQDYISWVENNIGGTILRQYCIANIGITILRRYWLNNVGQYCENVDILILVRYSLQYPANIVNNLAPILFATWGLIMKSNTATFSWISCIFVILGSKISYDVCF